jgi:hypothetical protein
VKVAFHTLRFPFEATLSKVTGITEKLGRPGPCRGRDVIPASKAIRETRSQPFIPDSSARDPFPALRRSNSPLSETRLNGRVEKSPVTVKRHGRSEDFKGRPKDARLKGGPRWILQ